MDLVAATRVFISGFCQSKSLTTPYHSFKHGSVWVLRDDPPRITDGRLAEVVTIETSLDQIVEHRAEFGPRWAISYVSQSGFDLATTKSAFKQAGLRLLRSEPLMVRDLNQPVSNGDSRVRQVTNLQDLDRVRKAMRMKVIPDTWVSLPDPPMRLFAAFLGDEAVGCVKSVVVREERACWVSALVVLREHRRKGLGLSLMNSLLQSDAEFGFRHSVLLASSLGAFLYPQIRYETIGNLTLWMPRKYRDV